VDILKDHLLVVHIAKAVADFRKDELKLSERQFAEKVGISRRSLKIIESGCSRDYSIGLIDKILNSMGLDFWKFFNRMFYLDNHSMVEGTLKGEYQLSFPEEGAHISALIPRQRAFFYGLMRVQPRKGLKQIKLPQADFVLYHGHRGKLVFHFEGKEYLLSEEKHFLFRSPLLPDEIYNPDQIREASCFLLTVPNFQ